MIIKLEIDKSISEMKSILLLFSLIVLGSATEEVSRTEQTSTLFSVEGEVRIPKMFDFWIKNIDHFGYIHREVIL